MTGRAHPLFDEAWRLYEQSFPANERRTLADHLRALEDPAFFACAAAESGALCALAFFWQQPEFTYLEHLAVNPALRGGGVGTHVVQWLLRTSTTPLILEIEPPGDDISRRRSHFYERLGFVPAPYPHWQFPYQPGTTGAPLCLMTRPAITQAQYGAFYRYLTQHVLQYTACQFRPR